MMSDQAYYRVQALITNQPTRSSQVYYSLERTRLSKDNTNYLQQ